MNTPFAEGTRFGRIARGTEMECMVELEKPLTESELRLAVPLLMRAVVELQAQLRALSNDTRDAVLSSRRYR